MSYGQLANRFAVALLVGTIGAIVWHANAAEEAPPKPQPDSSVTARVTAETLGGKSRYLTHVSTDKPIYRAGEKVYVRGVVLHHATHKAVAKDQQVVAIVEIVGPKGDVVASGGTRSEDSALGFSWTVPAGTPGGEYTAKVTYPGLGYSPAERKFDIRAYRAPRLKSQIKFLRDGYGPGDAVAATLHVERADGGVPTGAKVTVIARVDGVEAFRGPSQVNEQGDCVARFPLPKEIRRGEGTLAMVIEDGGVVETASKTIPILLQTVDLTMYPEGGDLVAGVPNRVYFEAFTPAKKPADLAGVVLDQDGKEVAKFRSEHEGRGRFQLTPKNGVTYKLQITEPAGINSTYDLPAVKSTGVTLSAVADTFAADQPITLTVASTSSGPLKVTLAHRERELALVDLKDVASGKPVTVKLTPGDNTDGVLIATVWDAAGKPLAERLVFRRPADAVQVHIQPTAKRYTPGGKVQLEIETKDAAGKPLSAVVGLTVTDDSVLEMIDKREQAPRLPVMVLLENDVRELADAHVYLDPDNADAPRAVDLLLGTQGWRRFATVKTTEFLAQHGDTGRRALALRLNTIREEEKLARGRVPGLAGGIPLPQAAAPRDAAVPEEARENAPADPAAVPDIAAAPPAAAPPAPAPPAADRPAPGPPAVKAELAAAEQKPGQAAARGGARPAQPLGKKRAQLQQALRIAEDAKADFLREADFRQRPIRNDFVIVRVYAHQVRTDRKPGERVDFTETLFWHAGVRTDAQGKATVEFGLNDSVTSFRVTADAFSDVGSLGTTSTLIESVEPFYLEPKLPLEVTQGDYLQVPISVVNASGNRLESASIEVQAHTSQVVDSAFARFPLAVDARVRKLMNVRVERYSGEAEFKLTAKADGFADQVTRKLLVKPRGFPLELAHGGLLQPGGVGSHTVTIPPDMVAGSLRSRVIVYPTPLASMTEALQRLIREPGGCFEQTSSTVYPLVMAQQYFMSHEGVDPKLVEKSADILERGYQRLIGFESKSGGFEWFGADPGHDALTAYGLLEFTDMSQVRHVDPAMLDRTKKWLLGQRDGKGGFNRATHTLHTWLPEPELATSYNTWALLEAGVDGDLSTEVKWIREAAERTENTYVMALAANVLSLGGDKEGENHLLDKLAGKQAKNGSLEGATQSVVGSGGDALAIEATALAVLAWLKNPSYSAQVEKSIKFLSERCKAGRFGSTQSTVLALRAIVAYDQSRAKPKAPGALQLVVDDKLIGEPVEFTADTSGVIELPEIAKLLTPGEHTVAVRMTDGSQMPYSIAVDLHRLKPASSSDCKLHLDVKLRDAAIDEGAVTEAEVVVVNRTGESIPCPTAIIGIPGGLEVRHDQLKELVKAGKISAYEVLGREVVLYWRALDKEQRVQLPISLVAAIPGTYTGPASRAYLYYTDEHKQWVDGFRVEVRAK